MSGSSPAERSGATKQLYKGRLIDLRLEAVTLPNQMTISLEVIRHPGAAAVVAIDTTERVTLIRQFRYAAGGFIWEIPAGKLDHGEAPLLCARRELQEEAGLIADELHSLGSVLTAPGFCDERIHLFLARQLRTAPQQLEPDEVLTVSAIPLAEALDQARHGEIDDAKTIAGLFRAAGFLRYERSGEPACQAHPSPGAITPTG